MFETKTWKDRITEYPTRRTLTKEDGTTEIVTVARNEGTVSEAGDAFSAENMNDLEQRIAAGFGVLLSGTLAAGETTLIFTGDSITTESTIDVYASVFGVSPTDIAIANGSLTLIFDAQDADISVKVRVS